MRDFAIKRVGDLIERQKDLLPDAPPWLGVFCCKVWVDGYAQSMRSTEQMLHRLKGEDS